MRSVPLMFQHFRFVRELHKKERIYLVLRRHWVIPVLRAVFWVGLLALLAFLEGILKTSLPALNTGVPAMLLAIVRSVLLMTAMLGLFIGWIMYYLNVQIITNERIVDINQVSLLNHKTSELNLDRFQDVTTQVKGPLANFFDFGNVHVQTAGEMENFVFNDIPNPHKVARIILELYEATRKNNNSSQT